MHAVHSALYTSHAKLYTNRHSLSLCSPPFPNKVENRTATASKSAEADHLTETRCLVGDIFFLRDAPIGTSARKHFVDAEHVVRVHADSGVEALLGEVLHQVFVGADTRGLQRLGSKLQE